MRKIVNPVFGKMIYSTGWESGTPLKLGLWGKEFFLLIYAVSLNEKEKITREQEYTLRYLHMRQKWQQFRN